jgi:predicted nucleic acid-binding protein
VKVVLDASVVVGWFTAQPHSRAAEPWLHALVRDPRSIGVPDLLSFELLGALARVGARQPEGWSRRAYERFLALPLRPLATTRAIAGRALELSATLRIAGWDAVYLAHAEAAGVPWLTADRKVVRRLRGDARLAPLADTPPAQ